MLDFESIRGCAEIAACIRTSDSVMREIGYTEHGLAHAGRTAGEAGKLLRALGYDARSCELARIAGYSHDIGNHINRSDHAQSGAILLYGILRRLDFPFEEITQVTAAVGHHDERTAAAVNPIAAALILADKSDVRRSRVREGAMLDDIHNRVNYAVRASVLTVEAEKRMIVLTLQIDTEICPVMDYFEIFLDRMVLCRKSADYLHCDFELIINDTRLL
ncbi:MAG: HD domain-containing protein [Clostridiales bacterium]|nr:HD domain-containing protein [Clostridiales bacterium]